MTNHLNELLLYDGLYKKPEKLGKFSYRIYNDLYIDYKIPYVRFYEDDLFNVIKEIYKHRRSYTGLTEILNEFSSTVNSFSEEQWEELFKIKHCKTKPLMIIFCKYHPSNLTYDEHFQWNYNDPYCDYSLKGVRHKEDYYDKDSIYILYYWLKIDNYKGLDEKIIKHIVVIIKYLFKTPIWKKENYRLANYIIDNLTDKIPNEELFKLYTKINKYMFNDRERRTLKELSKDYSFKELYYYKKLNHIDVNYYINRYFDNHNDIPKDDLIYAIKLSLNCKNDKLENNLFNEITEITHENERMDYINYILTKILDDKYINYIKNNMKLLQYGLKYKYINSLNSLYKVYPEFTLEYVLAQIKPRDEMEKDSLYIDVFIKFILINNIEVQIDKLNIIIANCLAYGNPKLLLVDLYNYLDNLLHKRISETKNYLKLFWLKDKSLWWFLTDKKTIDFYIKEYR